MRLFLDDLRPAPEGWVLVKTAREMIAMMIANDGNIAAISLDHDLDEGLSDGTDFVQAMVALKLHVPVVYMHSGNPSGRAYQIGLLEAANDHVYVHSPIKIVNCPPEGFLKNVENGWYDGNADRDY